MAGEQRPINSENPAISGIAQDRIESDLLSVAAPESQVEVALRTGIPDGQYIGLAAGERLELCDGTHLAHKTRQAIFVGCGEMVVFDRVHSHGHHRRHFALPSTSTGSRPVVTNVVNCLIQQKPIGRKSLGTNLLFFLDAQGTMLARLDNSMDYGQDSSGTWEFNLEQLGTLCRSVGVSFNIEKFQTARQFVDKRPAWTPPELEFEVNHLHTERVGEWGLALSYGLPIAVGAGLGGSFLLFIGPVRWFVAALEIIGIVVAMILTAWGHSKWRLKRSLRKMTRQDA
jgi:hypothetical protein